nr:ropporin-1-like protein [Aotus nancymaae]
MPLPDTMFCAQQIHVPPELPDILKQFTKAAIRTQPADVLQWSAGLGFFRGFSGGQISKMSQPPPKPVDSTVRRVGCSYDTTVQLGLTQDNERKNRSSNRGCFGSRAPPGTGRECHTVFSKQCHHKKYVGLTDLEQKWKNLCLPKEKFKALLQLDPCDNKIEWIKFLALGCSMLGGSLNTALKHLCEILTDDPEGGPARIPFETFSYVYRYLAKLDPDISPSETESYLASLKENIDARRSGMIGLSDFFFPKRKLLENLENSEDVGH